MSRQLSRRDEYARKRHLLLTHRPYLRRNVLKYLRKMGNLVSLLKKTPTGSKRPYDESSFVQDEEIEDLRPAKRRRVNGNHGSTVRDSLDDEIEESIDQAVGEGERASLRASSSRLGLPPSDFYGRSRSASFSGWAGETESSTEDLINGFIPKAPVKFQPAMRVRVLSINPLSQNQHEEFGQDLDRTAPIEFAIKCSIAVYAKRKPYPPALAGEQFELLCKKNLDCKLRVIFGSDGEISREVIMDEPFLFKANDLYVTTRRRKRNSSNGATEEVNDIASDYRLILDISRRSLNRKWPPVDIPPVSGSATTISKALRDDGLLREDITFYCQADPTKDSLTVSPQLQAGYGKLERQPLPYGVKLEVRWALPSLLTARAVEAAKIAAQSKLAALELSSPIDPVSPVRARREDETPTSNSPNSRSQRHRTSVPTYNVRQTFRDQLGRKPLKIKDEGGEPAVTYHFGKPGTSELGGKHQYEVSDLNCPFCIRAYYNDFNELFIHLTTDHSCFKFTVRRNKPPRFSLWIEISTQRPGPPIGNILELAETQRTFQLTQSSCLFDINKYVNGDDTWLLRRYGPQHNRLAPHLLPAAHDSSHSSSPHESRRSSPNTSTGTNDRMDFDLAVEKKDLYFLPTRVKTTLYVPETAKPLYDTITKRILPVGEELPDSDDEKDEFWLDMKHRDTVMDYTDVTPEEKEYANKWNLFITKENLPCSKFLDRALEKFAKQTKTWLIEKQSRKAEFLKQIEVFILRGDIEESVRDSVILILQRAIRAQQEERRDEDENVVMKEAPPPLPRNRHACSCGTIPLHYERMNCNGVKCPARFFHKRCAKEMGRPLLLREWKCNHCFS